MVSSISQSTPMLGGLTSYQKFIKEEGIDSISGFGVRDIKNIPLKSWDRMGGYGVYIDLDGTILKGEATVGQTNNAYICEVAPGKSLNPQKHIFEELIFVLSGRGATTVRAEGGKKQTFEWQEGSLFSPPLNTWYQHFNTDKEPARYLALRWGSRKFCTAPEEEKLARSVKLGGDQIEYEDEDEDVYVLFKSECAKNGFQVTWSPKGHR